MATSLSFSIPKFEANQPDLILQADALVTASGTLQLTKVRDGNPVYESMGRALYSAPVRIWDSKTGNVASFVTSFSFIINAPNPSTTADGLAFFLAPVDTQPQGSGGLLGLYPNNDTNNLYPVVAVEFDTFSNKDWDPVNTHVGINVNGIKSKKTKPWNLVNGEIANVVISYKASTKTLTSTLVYPNSTDDHNSLIVSYTFDLTSALPEFVRVGFSAASGLSADYKESHDVLSWFFESHLQTAAVTNDGGDDAAHNKAAHASSYGLI